MEIQITELSQDDCVQYQQYCQLLSQLSPMDTNSITQCAFSDQLANIKSNPYHIILVAKKDNVIVGSTTVLIEPKFIHKLSKVAHIEDVVVSSEQRCHGIGSMLINKAIDASKEAGCYKIILDCNETNSKYYSKFGFVKKELHMAYYLE